jgi:hypothetical protein
MQGNPREKPFDGQNQNEFEALSMKLTKDLYIIQQREQPIMMNAILAPCFMYSQKKELTFGAAQKITDEIYQYIGAKKCKTYISAAPENFAIKEGALNLGLSVKGNPLDRRQGAKATINLRDNVDELERLSLSYYCTPIAVALCSESIAAYAVYYHCSYLG